MITSRHGVERVLRHTGHGRQYHHSEDQRRSEYALARSRVRNFHQRRHKHRKSEKSVDDRRDPRKEIDHADYRTFEFLGTKRFQAYCGKHSRHASYQQRARTHAERAYDHGQYAESFRHAEKFFGRSPQRAEYEIEYSYLGERGDALVNYIKNDRKDREYGKSGRGRKYDLCRGVFAPCRG